MEKKSCANCAYLSLTKKTPIYAQCHRQNKTFEIGGLSEKETVCDKHKAIYEIGFECQHWNCFSSICELDGKDCSGDTYNSCSNYVDCNED